MSMTPTERKDRLAELATEIRSLIDEDPENRFDTVETEFTALKAEDDKYEARMTVARQAAAIPENRHPGDQSPDPTEGPTLLRKRDPYDLTEVRSMTRDEQIPELRSRALDAVEQAPDAGMVEGLRNNYGYPKVDWKNDLTKKLEGGTTINVSEPADGYARHLLATGSPEYAAEFNKYVTTGQPIRAALSTTGANGGFLIPFFLDPTVILSNTGVVNPFRQISRVETISTNVWHGVSSAGVTAEWTSEASEITDASPTFSQPSVTPIRADAYVQASFEVTQDSNIAAQIGMLFADAKDRLEGAAFATGTGSTQPKGIVTALQAVTASRVAANTNGAYGAVDNFALVNNLPARWQPNSSWLGHWFTANLIRQQVVVTNPTAVAGGQWVDYGPGIPSTLLGRPFYLSSAMLNAAGGIGLSSATASSDDILVIGDFSQFLIVDRIGMEVVYNPLVIGTNRRPTGEVGWAAFWRVGSDVTVADAFRMLRV